MEGTPSPASGGAAGSGGASADKSKQATLMISNTPAFRPRTPTQEEITSGTATSVRSYYVQKLKAYVDYHFADFLHTDPEVRLRHPLYASTCPKIEATTAASGAEWKPTSIMEPMDLSNCVTSLIQEGFYERTVSFWNFDPLLQSAFGLISPIALFQIQSALFQIQSRLPEIK